MTNQFSFLAILQLSFRRLCPDSRTFFQTSFTLDGTLAYHIYTLTRMRPMLTGSSSINEKILFFPFSST